MVASSVGPEDPGNQSYQQEHMNLLFQEGLSFSGFERDALFLNLESREFQDISGVSGIDSISDGRAAVLADFDNDGDLDIFLTAIQGEGHLLFKNNVGQANNFIRIVLEGRESGRDAFGAVVRLKTAHGIQTRVCSGGNGFLAQQDPRLLFGLGQKEEAEWMEVRWPSGKTQRFGKIPAGASLKIVESSEDYATLKDRPASLPDPVSGEDLVWHKLGLSKGGDLPALDLRSLNSQNQEASAVLKKGTSYFLNLWATWCGPCRKEMPELESLKLRFEAKGIQLLGISLDQEADSASVEAFARKLGVSYPLYRIDEAGIEKVFGGDQAFVPLSILVDEKGRVEDVFSGWSSETEKRIARLLQ